MKHKMTVSELYSEWLAYRKKDPKYSTARTYSYYFDNYLLKSFGDTIVNDLAPEDYAEFVSTLKTIKGTRGQDISLSTLNQIIRTFHSLFVFGNAEFGLKDPAGGVKLANRDASRSSVFTEEEINRIRNAALPYDPKHLGILLCLYTGISRSEISGLKWESIDTERRMLLVRNKLTPTGHEMRFLDRDIPVPQWLNDIMKLMKPMFKGSDYLLTGTASPMDVSVLRYHYINLLKKAGVPYKRFSALRNTFAQSCIENGADTKTLHRLLGNQNLNITIERYIEKGIERL